MKKYIKWIVFFLVAIGLIGSQFYVQHRYTSILQTGGEYQWSVSLSRDMSWIPTDYLTVHFLGNIAQWQGVDHPYENEEIYVTFTVAPSGLVQVAGASDQKPEDSNYLIARVSHIDGDTVEFKIPFNRVKVDLSKVNSKLYTNYRVPLIATFKVKDGYGVVTGIYAKGVPLENAIPEGLSTEEMDMMKGLDLVSGATNTITRNGATENDGRD